MTFEIDLTGRVALVTGGGQGVGRAISFSLAAAGAEVIVNDYFVERAAVVAKEIETAGGAARPCQFDVSDYAAVTDVIGSGRAVDILVNNAGNAGPEGFGVSLGKFVETEPSDWDRYFAVNLYGVMNCTRAVLPHMIASGGGRVISIISDAGRVGEPRMAPYAAAKAGAAGFMRSLARAKWGETASLSTTCHWRPWTPSGSRTWHVTPPTWRNVWRSRRSVTSSADWDNPMMSPDSSRSWPALSPHGSPGRPIRSTAATR